ncbi:hypothetical protein [Phage vB_KsaM-C1]|nr:hypothetical protein [Phage vB_KsaM-C1]
MTAQFPIPKERLEKIASWRETYGAGHNVMLPAEEAEALARFALAAHEQEPVAYMCDGDDGREYNGHNEFSCGELGIPLYTHPAPSMPAMNEQPFTMTQQEMRDYADIYRTDNDDGSSCFFPAKNAFWTEGYLSTSAFDQVFNKQEAKQWLENEIVSSNKREYSELLTSPALNPVVVVFNSGRAVVWDGYHRIAAAIVRDAPVYAVFCSHPAPVPVVPKTMPDDVYDILSKACGDNACLFADELWSACRAAMLNGGKS